MSTKNNTFQSELSLALPPFRVYLGNTWSILSDGQRDEMRETIKLVTTYLKSLGAEVFVSMTEMPPAKRSGTPAQRLWVRLRKEMGRCEMFVLIYGGMSEGCIQELRNAELHKIPTVILLKQPNPRPELTWIPTPHLLDHVLYNVPDEAPQRLEQWIDGHKLRLLKEINQIRTLRNAAHEGPNIGNIVKILRERREWTMGELARRCGMRRAEIAAFESDVSLFQPSYLDLVSICTALGIGLPDLVNPWDRLANGRFRSHSVNVAKEDGWTVSEYDRYLRHAANGSRLWNANNPTINEVRSEMNRWREENQRG